MTDLHISSMLISGAAQGAGATEATLSACDGLPLGANAFSALLAGKLELAVPASGVPPEALEGSSASLIAQAALESAPDLPRDAAEGRSPLTGASDEPADATLTGPDAGTQLLMAMGALPQQAAASLAPTTAKSASLSSASPGDAPAPQAAPPGSAVSYPVAYLANAPLAAASGAAVSDGKPAGSEGALPFAASAQRSQAAVAGPEVPLSATSQTAITAFAPSAAPASVHVSVPGSVGTPQWRENFATSVSLLATQRISSAELRVQPAELGPIQISIRIDAGEASIVCSAQHPDTRQALDAALPRLREMLEANGISVGNASVGPQFSGSGSPHSQPGSDTGHADQTTVEPDSMPLSVPRSAVRADQLVDIFA